jgi:hypothetical protein
MYAIILNTQVQPFYPVNKHTFNYARSNGVTWLNNALKQMCNIPKLLWVYLPFLVAPEIKIYLLNLAAASLWFRFPMSRIISIRSSLLR